MALVMPLNKDDWIKSVNDEEQAKSFLSKARQRKEKFQLREGILYKDSKLYVPKDKIQ